MADDAAPSDFERLEQERDEAYAAIARVRAQCGMPEYPLGPGAPYVSVRWLLTILDSVAAGGGATSGEPPTATVTHGPERGSFAWGPKGWR